MENEKELLDIYSLRIIELMISRLRETSKEKILAFAKILLRHQLSRRLMTKHIMAAFDILEESEEPFPENVGKIIQTALENRKYLFSEFKDEERQKEWAIEEKYFSENQIEDKT